MEQALDLHSTDQTAEYKKARLHQLIHRFLMNLHFFLFCIFLETHSLKAQRLVI